MVFYGTQGAANGLLFLVCSGVCAKDKDKQRESDLDDEYYRLDDTDTDSDDRPSGSSDPNHYHDDRHDRRPGDKTVPAEAPWEHAPWNWRQGSGQEGGGGQKGQNGNRWEPCGDLVTREDLEKGDIDDRGAGKQ